MKHIVGISEMKTSDQAEDILITHSLGSCIGLALYEPRLRIGGLIHCMLPLSTLDPERALERPCMFTDTGVLQLIQAMLDRGARAENLIAKVAGAASLLDNSGHFGIGARNQVILRMMLNKNQIPIAAEDTGGNKARTMSFHLDTGLILLRSGGVEYELR
jgi:chemotaxis protein CheD